MNCPGCGASITDDSKFCNYCGTKLPEVQQEDKKRREFRFEFNNENSVRKEQIRKERDRQRQEHELKMQEKQKELMEQQAKNNKFFLILFGMLVVVGIFMMLYPKLF